MPPMAPPAKCIASERLGNEKASGAKMNLEKTVGMYLGKWRNKNPRFKNIKWSTKPVKALGVFHGYAIDLEMI
jgi:hypothetical protein